MPPITDDDIRLNAFAELFKVSDSSYGEKYNEHLLEQYKLYVQMADKISERRATANSFFLSVNSFLLTILGIVPQLKSNIIEFTIIWVVTVAIGGIVFCIAWIRVIDSYKRLNGAKFRVIIEMESRLPVTMYASEWKYLKAVKHSSLSLLERYVPKIIIILYLFLTIGGILISLGVIKMPIIAFNG